MVLVASPGPRTDATSTGAAVRGGVLSILPAVPRSSASQEPLDDGADPGRCQTAPGNPVHEARAQLGRATRPTTTPDKLNPTLPMAGIRKGGSLMKRGLMSALRADNSDSGDARALRTLRGRQNQQQLLSTIRSQREAAELLNDPPLPGEASLPIWWADPPIADAEVLEHSPRPPLTPTRFTTFYEPPAAVSEAFPQSPSVEMEPSLSSRGSARRGLPGSPRLTPKPLIASPRNQRQKQQQQPQRTGWRSGGARGGELHKAKAISAPSSPRGFEFAGSLWPQPLVMEAQPVSTDHGSGATDHGSGAAGNGDRNSSAVDDCDKSTADPAKAPTRAASPPGSPAHASDLARPRFPSALAGKAAGGAVAPVHVHVSRADPAKTEWETPDAVEAGVQQALLARSPAYERLRAHNITEQWLVSAPRASSPPLHIPCPSRPRTHDVSKGARGDHDLGLTMKGSTGRFALSTYPRMHTARLHSCYACAGGLCRRAGELRLQGGLCRDAAEAGSQSFRGQRRPQRHALRDSARRRPRTLSYPTYSPLLPAVWFPALR